MGQSLVPNLETFYYVIPDGQMLIFQADRHRTSFALQDRETSDVFVWLGSTPPADVEQWFSIGGTANIDIYVLQRGVYGPIYITEGGATDGECTIMSSIREQPTIEDLPV